MLGINVNMQLLLKDADDWILTNGVVNYSTNEIVIERIKKEDIIAAKVQTPLRSFSVHNLMVSNNDFKLFMQAPMQIKGVNILFDDTFMDRSNQREVRFVLNDMSKVNSVMQFDVLPLKGRSKTYHDDYAIPLKVKDGSLVIKKQDRMKLLELLKNYGMSTKGLNIEDVVSILKQYMHDNYPPVVPPKITSIDLTKSKKDNIYCLFIGLDKRGFSVEHDNIDYDEEGVFLELGFGTCCSDKIIASIRLDISAIANKYEYVSYDIRLSKDELYIYFYEYPYLDEDVEKIKVEVDYTLN